MRAHAAATYAPIEIDNQAIRPPHLANIAYHRKARAGLSDDGTTVTV